MSRFPCHCLAANVLDLFLARDKLKHSQDLKIPETKDLCLITPFT